MQQSDWLEHNSNMAVEYSTVIMSMIPSKGRKESCPYHCVLGNTVPELEGAMLWEMTWRSAALSPFRRVRGL